MTIHLQKYWYTYFVAVVAIVMLPAELAKLPTANLVVFAVAAIALCIATVWSCDMYYRHPASEGVKFPKDELYKIATLVHISMSAIMLAADKWSALSILVANLALPLVYVGLFKFARRLDGTKFSEPIPWSGIAADYGIFCGGVAILWLATVV